MIGTGVDWEGMDLGKGGASRCEGGGVYLATIPSRIRLPCLQKKCPNNPVHRACLPRRIQCIEMS